MVELFMDGRTPPKLSIDSSFSGNERDRLFARPTPGRPFIDVAAIAGADLLGDGRSAIAVDFDGDGRLDLLVRATEKPKLTLLRNEGPSGGSIDVRFEGRAMGVGSRVTAHIGDQIQVHPAVLGSGYLSAGPAGVHIGLGETRKADRIEVRFPSGSIAAGVDVPADSIAIAREGKAELEVQPRKRPAIRLGGSMDRPAGVPTPQQLLEALEPGSQAELASSFERGARAKPLVVNLWASWCKPCQTELPQLSAWAASHPGTQVVALAVTDSRDDALRFAKRNGLKLAIGSFAERRAMKLGLDTAVPTTFLFGPDGSLHRGFLGPVDVRALEGKP